MNGVCQSFLAEGEACAPGMPCAPALRCTLGTCRPPSTRGDPCDLTQHSFPCDRIDDYCDPGTNTCLARGSVGQPCSNDPATPGAGDTCALGAWCDAGTCRALPPPGQPCAVNGHCLLGVSCDFATQICQQPFPSSVCSISHAGSTR